ncbi:MAG: hypothetical protein M1546_18230 [Chloroflexi bacterium]|nr:hypothetical protein [Chloroflexota bacterium]
MFIVLVMATIRNQTVSAQMAPGQSPTLNVDAVPTITTNIATAEPAGPSTIVATTRRFFPIVIRATAPSTTCPATSSAHYNLIPVERILSYDRPDYLQPDINLGLRSYSLTDAPRQLVDYSGNTDPNAPRLQGLFEPNRIPTISNVYRINGWNWGPDKCNGNPYGCRGTPITSWPVTLAGLATRAGEAVYPPERNPEIFGGGYKAMVIYAEEKRVSLVYTRQDSPAYGYLIHLENVCVNPNLLALYRAQNNAQGYRVTNQLPALRNNEALGTAAGNEIQVSVRDSGSFLDPRSRKDWWQWP